jgi:hypothetical protein
MSSGFGTNICPLFWSSDFENWIIVNSSYCKFIARRVQFALVQEKHMRAGASARKGT